MLFRSLEGVSGYSVSGRDLSEGGKVGLVCSLGKPIFKSGGGVILASIGGS